MFPKSSISIGEKLRLISLLKDLLFEGLFKLLKSPIRWDLVSDVLAFASNLISKMNKTKEKIL